MSKPEKIWEQANEFKVDRHKWKMGLDFTDCNSTEFETKMSEKYKYLKNSSSTIFKQLIEQENFNMEKLKYMLDMLKSIGEKKITFENASKEVGQKFADEYVKPLVEKANKKNEEEDDNTTEKSS